MVTPRLSEARVLARLALAAALHLPAVVSAQDTLSLAARGAEPCTWEPACSTGSVRALLREKGTFSLGRQKLVEYELVATGLPAGKLFTVWAFPTGEQAVPLYTGVTGDSAGGIVCADSAVRAAAGVLPTQQWCRTPLPGTMVPRESFVPSQPIKMALISTDDSVRAYATAFPIPLEAASGTCRLWLEVLSTRRDQFRLSGEGFQGGVEARIVSTSGNAVLQAAKSIPADGSFWLLLAPAVQGKQGGRSRISVSTAGCTVSLDYRWGRDLK